MKILLSAMWNCNSSPCSYAPRVIYKLWLEQRKISTWIAKSSFKKLQNLDNPNGGGSGNIRFLEPGSKTGEIWGSIWHPALHSLRALFQSKLGHNSWCIGAEGWIALPHGAERKIYDVSLWASLFSPLLFWTQELCYNAQWGQFSFP